METQNISGNIPNPQTYFLQQKPVFYITRPYIDAPVNDVYVPNKPAIPQVFSNISQRISVLTNDGIVFINRKFETVKDNSNAKSVLMGLIGLKDAELKAHSQAVENYSTALAEKLGLPESEIKNINTAAALHDTGKMYVPLSILQKPAKLNDQEQAIMQKHPAAGSNFLKHIPGIPKAVVNMVRQHHEKWDGTGYPDKLAGNEIPLGSRIISIADAFDAMTSNRSYRKALPVEEAIKRLKEGAGTQWDPFLVDKFVEMITQDQQNIQGQQNIINVR